jgi:hypothetical protein
LTDEDGYYVADAHQIRELLDVKKYIELWPLIPTAELHASSVQHPRRTNYRWLLNTRRVPVIATERDRAEDTTTAEHDREEGGATCDKHVATERPLPACAGVGSLDRPVWLCKSCCSALCGREPIMPFFALAKWNWGGRAHPDFRDVSIAMQTLHGLAGPVRRFVVLPRSEHEDDQERGRAILLCQPTPEEIEQKLLPRDEDVSK